MLVLVVGRGKGFSLCVKFKTSRMPPSVIFWWGSSSSCCCDRGKKVNSLSKGKAWTLAWSLKILGITYIKG